MSSVSPAVQYEYSLMLAVSVSPVLLSGLLLCTISAAGLDCVHCNVQYCVKYEFTVESVRCAVPCEYIV